MPQDSLPECTGKCQQVETYKSINRALSKQHTDMKNSLSIKERENVELKQHILDLQNNLSLKEREISELKNMLMDAKEIASISTEVFTQISSSVKNGSGKLAIFTSKLLNYGTQGNDTTISNNSLMRNSLQARTPSNVSRIKPIIRTPNGLMQSVCISLPRIDHATLFAATGDRLVNSTTISENGSSSTIEDTVRSEPSENGDISEQPTVISPVRSEQQRQNSDSSTQVQRLPRHTSESPFLGFDEADIQTQSSNPQILPLQNEEQGYEWEGLSIIQEVTEVDYSMNPTVNHDNADESSGGEEIVSHETSRTMSRSNKENALRTQNMTISQASCSTPYNRAERSYMKTAKVVLQPLNMDEIVLSNQTRNRNESESSTEHSAESVVQTRRKPSTRKRNDSQISHATDSEDEEHRSRPKRRATPTSFKEPSLNTKMRRPK